MHHIIGVDLRIVHAEGMEELRRCSPTKEQGKFLPSLGRGREGLFFHAFRKIVEKIFVLKKEKAGYTQLWCVSFFSVR